jgi:hypothetical protein
VIGDDGMRILHKRRERLRKGRRSRASRSTRVDLAKQAIALRSVRAPGYQTAQVAAVSKSALVAGGFSEAGCSHHAPRRHGISHRSLDGSGSPSQAARDLGTYGRGRGQALGWERDPFTPVIENGLLYGRGASDMKLDDALAGLNERIPVGDVRPGMVSTLSLFTDLSKRRV